MKKPARLPKMPKVSQIHNGNLDAMVERVRLASWKRKGEHDTVHRLRTDKGFAKAVVEHAININASQRAPLFRDAMNACIRNRQELERNWRAGHGIWVAEMEPLTPSERGLALKELRRLWDVPETIERPDVH